jgi:hypothetical protein
MTGDGQEPEEEHANAWLKPMPPLASEYYP